MSSNHSRNAFDALFEDSEKSILLPKLKKAQAVFKEVAVSHPIWISVARDVAKRVTYAEKGEITGVVGPTGVGKTRLATELLNKFNSSGTSQSQYVKKPEPPVAIYLELVAGDDFSFNWKDFYLRILAELNPAFATNNPSLKHWERPFSPNAPNHELRRLTEDMVKKSGVQILILDEAQHLEFGNNLRIVKEQLETLKSLANTCGVKIIMFGWYRLMSILRQEGQICRRVRFVNFRRYNMHNDQDRASFVEVLSSYKEVLEAAGYDLKIEPEVVAHLFSASLGCVGTLQRCLSGAMVAASFRGDKHIDLAAIKDGGLDPGSLKSISEDIQVGESLFNPDDNSWAALREHLGNSPGKLAKSQEDQSTPKAPVAPAASAGSKRSLKPGESKPRRNKVSKPS